MGNSQSHSQRHLHTTSHPPVSIVSVTPHKVTLNKKKSRMQLATKLSCISGWSSQESLPSTTTSTSASDEKRCLSEDSLSSPHERDDATVPEHPNEYSAAYASFLDAYPEYRQTWMLDSLRRSDFSRLMRSGETYVDYMGGSLYPESLVHVHADFLSRSILGNTHSVNNSSQMSSTLAAEAREAVLTFFNAPAGYTVIFTANASAALKLVGESYPFRPGGSFILGADSHNSVNGIRTFALQGGAKVCYLRSQRHGGVYVKEAEAVLHENKPDSLGWSPCLFALTGQSNISNTKNPLSLVHLAKSLGYHTLLDAAALAPTSSISLRDTPVDAMAISFYKMFGFPTGVGALVVKESFLKDLQRPWFAGGTVDVVQVPGTLVTMTESVREQFEDGTINYLSLPAVTQGLKFLSTYMPLLPVRLSALTHHLATALSNMRHDSNHAPLVRILSRVPTKLAKNLGDQAETGSTISLIFLSSDGSMLPNSFIEHAATQRRISLRTGCVCNPGGAAAILDIESDMDRLHAGVTLREFERVVGHELGVVRISLGLASSFEDVHKVLQFASDVACQKSREALWSEWWLHKQSNAAH